MKTQAIITNIIAFLLLIILLFILAFSILNKNAITAVKILCNKVEIDKKIQSDIFKDLSFILMNMRYKIKIMGKLDRLKKQIVLYNLKMILSYQNL